MDKGSGHIQHHCLGFQKTSPIYRSQPHCNFDSQTLKLVVYFQCVAIMYSFLYFDLTKKET